MSDAAILDGWQLGEAQRATSPGEQRVAYLQVDAGPHPSGGFPSPRPAAVRGRVVMTRSVPPTKEHQP